MIDNTLLLVDAIKRVRPDSEFTFTEDDYSTIEWHKLEGSAPSLAEINAEIELIKKERIQAEKDAAAKRKIAEDKLAALGFTLDDLKALGLA